MGTDGRASESRGSWTNFWVERMARKVVFLRSKSHGGVEPRLDKEARALVGGGYEVHVVLWDREAAFPAEETRSGYSIHRLHSRAPEGRAGLLLKMPRWWRFIRRQLRSIRPDVIHAVDLDSLWPALRANRSLRAKIVYDVFDFYAPMIARRIPRWIRDYLTDLERRLALRADLVILPDLSRVEFFGPHPPSHVVEVMNVPEDRPVPPVSSERFTVFYAGQIARDRGIPELVRSCEQTGARLIVAGHGPDEATLIPLVESSPLAEFIGHLSHDDVLQRTAAADVVAALYDPALPNNRKASPNKLFEAMMLAKPILTNEGTTLGDFVARERLGGVGRYGDLESIRQELERLMLSPDECADMGARGRRLYESRFRWDVMRDRLLDSYRELLKV